MSSAHHRVMPLDFPLFADENLDTPLPGGDDLEDAAVAPFIAVVERQRSAVRVRVRTTPPW